MTILLVAINTVIIAGVLVALAYVIAFGTRD